jgi:hypothetical protein
LSIIPPDIICGAKDRDGTHLNYGDGPPPDIDKFRRAVAEKVV